MAKIYRFALPLLVLASGCHQVGTPQTSQTPQPVSPPVATVKEPIQPPKPTPPPAKTYSFEKPKFVRGIYLTAWSAGSPRKLDHLLQMMDGSVLNSVVVDIRDEGQMYWDTGLALAEQSGANHIGVAHPQDLMKKLAASHVYPIARIACFRDNFVPKQWVSRAIQDASGRPWHDRKGNLWLDPYNKDNWEYLGQIVDFALRQGFPEIQLDYVRFPSEGAAKTQRFPGKAKFGWGETTQEDAIAQFAEFMRKRTKAGGGYFSADIFGIISSSKSSQGIGQQLEKIAKPFDCISPMVYPSHFNAGEYGIRFPNASPYETVNKALLDFKKRVPTITIRPWLQDFTIKVKNQPTTHYGVKEIRDQIRAAEDAGIHEFLIWNAANRYTAAAYRTSVSP